MTYTVDKIRNIAIIAHVDHGKTTLMDGLIRQTLEIRNIDALGNLIMDNMDQEKERGITIKAKNASIYYKDFKINIVDTPGHADFGGEVERTLRMVEGVVLLVDAQEGPMPQTKFVLKKAIELGHKVVVVINKVDKPAADCAKALTKVEDLFLDLGASDEQMLFSTIYASGVQGKAGLNKDQLKENLFDLLDIVIKDIPQPKISVDENSTNPLQMLVLSLNYDSFKGKMAVGRIFGGFLEKNMMIHAIQEKTNIKGRVTSLMVFDGLTTKEVEKAEAGEIVMVAGIEEVSIGDTISTPEYNKVLTRVKVDEPTIQMTFGVNTSPFAGKEGDKGTSRQIRERLYKELETNVSLQVKDSQDSADKFIVSGRGELHLSVLIESMRREGFELEVSKPEVIFHTTDSGEIHEPFEFVEISVPQEFQGVVMQELGKRAADITDMSPNDAGTEFQFTATMPTRSLIGLKSLLIVSTKGVVIMNTVFDSYRAKIKYEADRSHGSLVSTEKGNTMAFALNNAQLRGVLFIGPQVEVYEGMVIGQCAKDEDLELNPTKGKQLTNMRTKASDDGIVLTPPRKMTLETSLEYIGDDELVEVTPENIRIRKKILQAGQRKRNK
ncbi:translational GTPase TypA [Candidatus Gracilibacteria bacterium]|nr:translational GTPase TypA [Candidatus Gracilibacteria bacterium]